MAYIQQIRAIYVLGRKLGMVDGTHDDMLHTLISTTCGVDSVRALSEQQANDVIGRLQDLCQSVADRPDGRFEPMSAGQARKVWAEMYKLAAEDPTKNGSSLGDRLCGIIRRELHTDAAPRDPFRWLDYQQGARLIEIIKGYTVTARVKRIKQEAMQRGQSG